MPRYRVYYLKDSQRLHFRNTPPGSPQGSEPYQLKLKDYQEGGQVDAPSPYSAWKHLKETEDRRPIEVGDALELDTGALYVCRWTGFEEARWFVPEPPAASQ